MTQRRLGLLGFGHVAEHGHAPEWLRRDDFRVVAVADPSPQRRHRARQLFPAAVAYDDPRALLAREALDVVDISAPPAWHRSLCVHSAAAGCHILCEKPLAISPDELLEMRAASAAADVALVTVHNWKQSAQYRWVDSLLEGRAIGALRRVRLEVERVGRSASVGDDWRVDRQQAGGGILVDHGWHTFYLLLAMARQTPRRIRATVERRRYTELSVEDTATCDIELDTLQAEIFLTWAGERRRNRWELVGDNGSVVVDGDRGDGTTAAAPARRTFPESLSEGSHHAAWFAGVVDDLAREIDDPQARGSNLREAELCLHLTSLAYASSAAGGTWLALPGAPPPAPRPAAPFEMAPRP